MPNRCHADAYLQKCWHPCNWLPYYWECRKALGHFHIIPCILWILYNTLFLQALYFRANLRNLQKLKCIKSHEDLRVPEYAGTPSSSTIQKLWKLSAHESPSNVKSRKFSLAKIKCYTVFVEDIGNSTNSTDLHAAEKKNAVMGKAM